MTNRPAGSTGPSSINWLWVIYAGVVLCALIFLFRAGLAAMVDWWENKEEYSHGYLIPVVAIYLAWLRAEKLSQVKLTGALSGLSILALGLALQFVGELSAVYVITQYAFVISLIGLAIIAYGWVGARILWVPIVYLFFMIPLPSFLYNTLSSELQLLSSQFGVAFLRFTMRGLS